MMTSSSLQSTSPPHPNSPPRGTRTNRTLLPPRPPCPLWWSAVVLALLVSTIVVAEQEWRQCRGPKSCVAADDPAVPDTWIGTTNVAWKIDVRGGGWRTPVVSGDH